MALSINTANVVSAGVNQGGSGTTTSLSVTIAAGVNRLLVCAAVDSSAGVHPATFTFNSVAVTPVPSGDKSNTQQDVYWAYVDSPTVGTFTLQSIYAAGTNATELLAIPLIGADLTKAPSAGTGTQGVPSASISCIAPASGANDISFGATGNRGTSQTNSGTQTNLPTMPLNGVNGTGCFTAGYLAGALATPTFNWTITSGNWSAIAVTVFGAASGPQYITKWTPFRWACAMRSLQQGANNVGNRQQNRLALLASAITNANGAATWAKWRVGENSRVSSCGLVLNVPLVPGFVPPVGTVDDGT